jgi:hypothetical protein
MSFKCTNCGSVQKNGVKPAKIVTKIRQKEYVEMRHNHRGFLRSVTCGRGHETVKEHFACEECSEILRSQEVECVNKLFENSNHRFTNDSEDVYSDLAFGVKLKI